MGFLSNMIRLGKGNGDNVKVLVPTAFRIPSGNNILLHLELKNEPGVVAKVTDIVKESGLNISNITTPTIVKGDYGDLFVMIENCDRKCGETLSKNMKKELGKLLIDINVYDSRENFLFIPNSVIEFMGVESIIIPKFFIEEVYRRIYEKYPDASTLSLLRNTGIAIGSALFKGLFGETAMEKGVEEHYSMALKFFEGAYASMGFGNAKITYKNGVVFNIEIINNFESVILKNLGTTRAIPELTIGILQGYLSSMTERRVEIHVLETLSKGSQKDLFEARIYEYAR